MNKISLILIWIVIFSLVFGILLMVISDGIDVVFLAGLGMFSLSLIIFIVAIIWSSAGWMDKQARKYFD